MKRSASERIADLEAKLAKTKADADRRLAVASDPLCGLLWETENGVRKIATHFPAAEQEKWDEFARFLAGTREERWSGLRGS